MKRVVERHGFQFFARFPEERTARRREDQAADLAAIAVLQALEDRALFAVDRHKLRAGCPKRRVDKRAAADQTFLVCDRDASAVADRAKQRLQRRIAGDRKHRDVRLRFLSDALRRVFSGEQDRAVRKPVRIERCARRDKARMQRVRLPVQRFRIGPAAKPDRFKAVRVHVQHVDGLRTDRAGAAEDKYRSFHFISLRLFSVRRSAGRAPRNRAAPAKAPRA